ncbi:MAG: D-alanyl-D-alanine carboxypeptidase family protein, partial [Clostridia bacterium]|nr:D-alanyl-D-alanine carboxypeptidase family protein [Clostridia bacterium]
MDDALDLIFGKEGSELRTKYSGLIAKIQMYRENVSSDIDGFYDGLKNNGIYFGFMANYGFMNAPLTKDADLISDALVSLEHAAYGATAAKVGAALPEDYIEARIAEGKGKYISPDKAVDLSSAYAPDTTWVVKNAHRFGFILRYPKDKEDITGYNYEPWHIRYVGAELAGQLYETGLTLDEYYGVP